VPKKSSLSPSSKLALAVTSVPTKPGLPVRLSASEAAKSLAAALHLAAYAAPVILLEGRRSPDTRVLAASRLAAATVRVHAWHDPCFGRPRVHRLAKYLPRTLMLAALLAFGGLLLRTAWLSDDAFITMRVIDNLLHGFGLRWNIAERVQVFTHPLWLAVLVPAYALTREVLWTVGLVSIAFTLAAVVLVARTVSTRAGMHQALIFILLISCSRTVLSYGTSGLENPLALFLVVLLWRRCDRDPTTDHATADDTQLVVLLLALIALTRIDLLALALPIAWPRLSRARFSSPLRALVLGGSPLWLWEIFSVLYYGALMPNTALAKLGAGIPHNSLATQGWFYLLSLVTWDPFGAGLLFAGFGVGLLSRARPVAIGVLLYAGYLNWIGGDFMVGRFYSTSIVLCAAMLCASPWCKRTLLCVAALPLLLLLSPAPGLAWVSGLGPVWGDDHGVVDERYYYWANTGLMEEGRARDLNEHYYARFGLRMRGLGVIMESCIGMVGYYAGPTVHIVDPLALGDPLLSRLPAVKPNHYRPGHYERLVPVGYLESSFDPKVPLVDPSLRPYWNAIAFVTRGPLWSAPRMRMAVALALGRLDYRRDDYLKLHPPDLR
jgi:arabinofuranosyltransferase